MRFKNLPSSTQAGKSGAIEAAQTHQNGSAPCRRGESGCSTSSGEAEGIFSVQLWKAAGLQPKYVDVPRKYWFLHHVVDRGRTSAGHAKVGKGKETVQDTPEGLGSRSAGFDFIKRTTSSGTSSKDASTGERLGPSPPLQQVVRRKRSSRTVRRPTVKRKQTSWTSWNKGENLADLGVDDTGRATSSGHSDDSKAAAPVVHNLSVMGSGPLSQPPATGDVCRDTTSEMEEGECVSAGALNPDSDCTSNGKSGLGKALGTVDQFLKGSGLPESPSSPLHAVF